VIWLEGMGIHIRLAVLAGASERASDRPLTGFNGILI
jgi:hypothetical protein